MSPAQPFIDLHTSMDRLAHLLSLSVQLLRVSTGHFQNQLFPILAELGEATEKARSALESAAIEEIRRADVASALQANAQAGEA